MDSGYPEERGEPPAEPLTWRLVMLALGTAMLLLLLLMVTASVRH